MREELVGALTDFHRPYQGNWRGKCPSCVGRTGKPDRRGALTFDPAKGLFYCYKCQWGGRLHDEERLALGLPEFTESEREWLPAEPSVQPTVGIQPPEDFAPLWCEPLASALAAEPARDYLRSREVGDDLWRVVNIGACLQGYYAGRVVIPIMDGTRWLGWVARSWTKVARVPYLYPKDMRRGETLFNETVLDRVTDVPVFVVEGVFDALALWPDAVAVLGKPTPWQRDRIALARRPVAVTLDGDAWQEGHALAVALQFRGRAAGAIRLPPLTDPDDIPLPDIRAAALACIGQFYPQELTTEGEQAK